MKNKDIVMLLLVVSIFLISGCTQQTEKSSDDNEISDDKEETFKEVSNESLTGNIPRNQIWSGTIIISGETFVGGDLTIEPGTLIKFAVPSNWSIELRETGREWDRYDPTYTEEYTQSHSYLSIGGKLKAIGTNEQPIIFTSNSSNPTHCDWIGINVMVDGSIIEHSIFEWAVHAISIVGNNPQPNTRISNNYINNSFTCGVCLGSSSAQVYDNEIYNCGHEGIDVQSGDPKIENNLVGDSRTGVVVISGSPTIRNNRFINAGSCLFSRPEATPIEENNVCEPAPEDTTIEWRFLNFAYTLRGDPIIYE